MKKLVLIKSIKLSKIGLYSSESRKLFKIAKFPVIATTDGSLYNEYFTVDAWKKDILIIGGIYNNWELTHFNYTILSLDFKYLI